MSSGKMLSIDIDIKLKKTAFQSKNMIIN